MSRTWLNSLVEYNYDQHKCQFIRYLPYGTLLNPDKLDVTHVKYSNTFHQFCPTVHVIFLIRILNSIYRVVKLEISSHVTEWLLFS